MIRADPTQPPAPPRGRDVPESRAGPLGAPPPGPPAAPAVTPIAPPEPRTHTVMLEGGEGGPFVDCSPRALTVHVGDAVRWKNNDHLLMPHSVASWGDGSPEKFDTGPIEPGDLSRAIRFRAPGTYEYRCFIHSSTSPVAVIEVLPANHPKR